MLNYQSLPNPYAEGPLSRYFEKGIPPGSFFTAILCNNLRESCACADPTNQRLIFEYVKWLYNEAPLGSWGSEEVFQEWLGKFVTEEGA